MCQDKLLEHRLLELEILEWNLLQQQLFELKLLEQMLLKHKLLEPKVMEHKVLGPEHLQYKLLAQSLRERNSETEAFGNGNFWNRTFCNGQKLLEQKAYNKYL